MEYVFLPSIKNLFSRMNLEVGYIFVYGFVDADLYFFFFSLKKINVFDIANTLNFLPTVQSWLQNKSTV